MIDLKSSLRAHLSGDFESSLRVLRAYKDDGGTKEEAYRILTEMRDEPGLSEATDDRLLELMDVAAGFVPAHWKIWD